MFVNNERGKIMSKSALDRAIKYFENLTPQTVEQYEAAHDAMACLREAKKDKARLRAIDRAMKNIQ